MSRKREKYLLSCFIVYLNNYFDMSIPTPKLIATRQVPVIMQFSNVTIFGKLEENEKHLMSSSGQMKNGRFSLCKIDEWLMACFVQQKFYVSFDRPFH